MHYKFGFPDYFIAAIPLLFYFILRVYLSFYDKHFGMPVFIFNLVKIINISLIILL